MNKTYMLILAVLQNEELANTHDLMRIMHNNFEILDYSEALSALQQTDYIYPTKVVYGVNHFKVTAEGQAYFNQHLGGFKQLAKNEYVPGHYIYHLLKIA